MNKTYILKSVKEDLTAYNGFKWHGGIVEAPDFKPTKECGAGLHGFLMGEGEGTLANWDSKAKWIVAEVDKDSLIDLEGKVKFPKCKVIFIGDRKEATDLIILKGGKSVIGSFVTSGDFGTSTSGDYGTSTSGKKGTSTSGDGGTLVIKYWDENTGRYKLSTAYVGENGILPNTPYVLNNKGEFVKKDLT